MFADCEGSSFLSQRGTSGERIEERGFPKNAPPLPEQLGLGHTAQKLDAEPSGARQELAAARGELDGVIAGIRRFIAAEKNDDRTADLAGVLHALAQRALAGTAARIEACCDPGASARLSDNQAVQLANIAREALSTSLRHARPSQVRITLRSEAGAVRLEVSDDGIGFHRPSQKCGVGLTSMTARTREIGGTLDLQSAPGKGTRVVVHVPASATVPIAAGWPKDEPNET